MREAEIEVKTGRKIKMRYDGYRHKWFLEDVKTGQKKVVTPARLTAILDFIGWINELEEMDEKMNESGR